MRRNKRVARDIRLAKNHALLNPIKREPIGLRILVDEDKPMRSSQEPKRLDLESDSYAFMCSLMRS